MECIESALLGGFYYKHFLLASNVIGLGAKGTMNRSVKALKNTFESVCFPVLDKIRADLGVKIDAELASNHAKIMNKILEKNPNLPPSPFVLTPSAPIPGNKIDPHDEANMLHKLNAAEVSHLSAQARYTPTFVTPIKSIKHSK